MLSSYNNQPDVPLFSISNPTGSHFTTHLNLATRSPSFHHASWTSYIFTPLSDQLDNALHIYSCKSSVSFHELLCSRSPRILLSSHIFNTTIHDTILSLPPPLPLLQLLAVQFPTRSILLQSQTLWFIIIGLYRLLFCSRVHKYTKYTTNIHSHWESQDVVCPSDTLCLSEVPMSVITTHATKEMKRLTWHPKRGAGAQIVPLFVRPPIGVLIEFQVAPGQR